jgi:hypothetical protein
MEVTHEGGGMIEDGRPGGDGAEQAEGVCTIG